MAKLRDEFEEFKEKTSSVLKRLRSFIEKQSDVIEKLGYSLEVLNGEVTSCYNRVEATRKLIDERRLGINKQIENVPR